MKVIETKLPGVIIIEPKAFGDDRGFFMETWNQVHYEEIGLPANFVQDNLSFSNKGVLRGLHYQNPNPQGKLVYVLQGEVFDVAVDIRAGSPTFGEWVGIYLSSENKRQFFIPKGFAHGFCVTSETALFAYKCDDIYNPQAEYGVIWNDPNIGIKWPIDNPLLSDKDTLNIRLREVDLEQLPSYSLSTLSKKGYSV